jgi:dienelactone hydrolase
MAAPSQLVTINGPFGPIPLLAAGVPRASKAAVILAYGLGGQMAVQWPEAERLAAAGYAVIIPEAPHHGLRADGFLERMKQLSEEDSRASFLDLLEAWATEIPTLVDWLAANGGSKFVLAGVSMGGHWALAGPLLDPRIGAVVSLLGDPEWDERAASPHLSLDAWAKTALLAITADDDEVVPPQPMRAFVDRLHARFPAKSLHRSLPVPGRHWMAPEVWESAWVQTIAWLDGLR